MTAPAANKIMIVDIDGTLSVVGPRQRFIEGETKDREAFYADDFDDLPIPNTCHMVQWMSRFYEVIFCTSRRECAREKTQRWLRRNLGLLPVQYRLIMRPNDDDRQDAVSKHHCFMRETTEEERSRVAFVLENSHCEAAMWRMHGYICFQCK